MEIRSSSDHPTHLEDRSHEDEVLPERVSAKIAPDNAPQIHAQSTNISERPATHTKEENPQRDARRVNIIQSPEQLPDDLDLRSEHVLITASSSVPPDKMISLRTDWKPKWMASDPTQDLPERNHFQC